MEIEKKITAVKNRLKPLKKVVVAFSGGKDSFFLLKIAVETLGKNNVTAFFVQTDLLCKNDNKRVDYFAKLLDFDLIRITIDVTGEKKIMSNPIDRCYYCKTKIFSTLREEAAKRKTDNLLDGTTYSDLDEYRPGLKAIEELKILSPLRDAKITSEEVVAWLTKIPGIQDYFLTSSTCLATRFPYNYPLTKDILEKFAAIETYFVDTGIYPVKIRFIQDGIRIETEEKNFGRVLEKKDEIIRLCKEKELKFITLDIEGLKSGAWDPVARGTD